MRRTWGILAVATALGVGYGWTSAIMNRNPYHEPGTPAMPDMPLDATQNLPAWTWRPSAAWLPSYLLCVVPTNGYGITWTRSGYLFRNNPDRLRYSIASSIMGAVLGVGVGGLIVFVLKQVGRPTSAS